MKKMDWDKFWFALGTDPLFWLVLIGCVIMTVNAWPHTYDMIPIR